MERVKAADSEGEVSMLQIVHEVSKKNWQAATWLLERRHADRWAKKAPIPIDAYELYEKQLGKDSRQIEKTSEDELDELTEQILIARPELIERVLSHHPLLMARVNKRAVS